MKKLFIAMFAVMFMVSLVSAIQTNGLYDPQTKTLTLTDKQDDTLVADITLGSPLVYNVVRGEDRLVGWYHIDAAVEMDGKELFKSMRTLDKKDDDKEKNKEITLKLKSVEIIQVPVYSRVCTGSNETFDYECHVEVVGTKDRDVVTWNVLDKKDILSVGTHTVGLFADVEPNERMDWIPTFYDYEVVEWAIWQEALSQSLEAYYQFEGVAGNVLDATPNGNDATAIGVTRGVPGIIGNAFSYDGVNDYVSPPFLGVAGDLNFTYNAWFNMSINVSLGGAYAIIASRNTATNRFVHMRLEDSQVSIGGVRNDGGTIQTVSASVILPGEWNMLTFTGNTTTINFYLNGVLTESKPIVGPVTLNTLAIGASVTGVAAFFANGTIDEVGIWDRELTGTEVNQVWNSGDGISYPGDTVPHFTTIPADQTIETESPPVGIGVFTAEFSGVDGDGDEIAWSIDDIVNFQINQSGYIDNVAPLPVGTYPINVTITDGLHPNSTIYTLTVAIPTSNPIAEICADSDVSFIEASAISGILLTLMLFALVIGTLVLSIAGVIDFNNISDKFTIENMPATVVIIGLLFLVIATMSFLISGSVCVAYGA